MKNVHVTVHDIELVKGAAQYLEMHLDRHITIQDLSEITGISVKKLKAGFMTVFQQGVNTYHRRMRMEKAKGLLLQDKPLKYIAKQTGYTSETSLTRSFKNNYGMPPLVWKKAQQGRMA